MKEKKKILASLCTFLRYLENNKNYHLFIQEEFCYQIIDILANSTLANLKYYGKIYNININNSSTSD